MKTHLFSITRHSTGTDLMLLLLRLVSGGFLLTHGWGKFIQLLAGPPYQFADPIGLGVTASFILVVFAEFGCSILVILGLASRLATIPIIINMSVIAFIVQASDAFSVKELPLFYLTVFFVILVLGPGRYSLDKLLSKR